jgi:hypothetical protein
LLAVERREREPARYRMLESTRAYARALLEESGERESVAQRHARYFRSALGRAEASWRANSNVAVTGAFDALLADFHEVEAALRWAIGEQQDLVLGGELIGVVLDVWVRYCLGTGPAEEEAAVPLEHGIVHLLSVLKPSEVITAAPAPDADAARTQTVDPRTSWLGSFVTSRSYRAGDVIFHKRDVADELFYIRSGVVSLNEIGVDVGQHELLGEIALFSSQRQRTATATCATDVAVLAIDRRAMLDLYERDVAFRMHVIGVLTSRLIADLERVRNSYG